MTKCINSTTKVEYAAAVVTKDGAEVDYEDVDKDVTHKPEAAVTVTRTETVPTTELVVTRRDPNMPTKPRLRI